MTTIHVAYSKRLKLHRKQNGRCAICNEGLSLKGEGPKAPTLDHIIPKSHGGPGALHNLRLVHKGCNEARGNEMESVTVDFGGQRVLRAGLP